jgi:hypothetical protein
MARAVVSGGGSSAVTATPLARCRAAARVERGEVRRAAEHGRREGAHDAVLQGGQGLLLRVVPLSGGVSRRAPASRDDTVRMCHLGCAASAVLTVVPTVCPPFLQEVEDQEPFKSMKV